MNEKIEKQNGEKYTLIDLGALSALGKYSYLHPKLQQNIPGKLFLGEELNATGSEISFQLLPPHTKIPFLHSHHDHEEIYIFLQGSGNFQVDENQFPIKEGSIVRVLTSGKRSWENCSDERMLFIVIQCKEDTIQNYFVNDGFRVEGKIL